MTKDIIPEANEVFLKNKLNNANLLNRPPPENYAMEQLISLNAQIEEDFPSGQPVLVFRIAKDWLALPNYCIREITHPSYIHQLPHITNDVLLGISNVHGELLIAISMQAFLNIPNSFTQPYSDQDFCKFSRIVVLEINKNVFVFSVDEIYGLARIELDLLEELPMNITKSIKNYSIGIFALNDIIVSLLDEIRIIETLNEKYL